MKHETIFVPVKMSESLLADQNHFYVKRPTDAVRQPVEELKNRYVFSEGELNAIIKEKEDAVYAKLHYSHSCYQRLHAAAKRLADDVDGCKIGALGNDSLRNIRNLFLMEEKNKS